jgi:hypothetical protein
MQYTSPVLVTYIHDIQVYCGKLSAKCQDNSVLKKKVHLYENWLQEHKVQNATKLTWIIAALFLINDVVIQKYGKVCHLH